MTAPKHHPDDAVLFDYASGGLPGPFSLTIATHLALCPKCRRALATAEAAGGAALSELPASSIEEGLLAKTLARLDGTPAAPAAAKRSSEKGSFGVPRPLRDLIDRPIEKLPFKRLGGGEVFLLDAPAPFRSYVLRIAGGDVVPKHGHSGTEMTLVLRGGYADGDKHFDEGDLSVCDRNDRHAPHADPEGCTCLIVSAGRLRMPDPLTALVARWFGV